MEAGNWKRPKRLEALALALACLLSSAPASLAQGHSIESSAPAAAGTRAEAATRDGSITFGPFGARLLALEAARRGPDSNTVLSPASGGLALSLALLGARGTTATALANMLGYSDGDPVTIQRRGRVLLSALRARRDVQLEIANAVWVDTSARLVPAFASAMASWDATVAALPLASSAALTPINAWAANATHGRIKRILDDELPDSARLFLANAVYFKGLWLDRFQASETSPHEFILASGRRVRVPSMERTGSIAYRREENFQVARLPYRGNRAALYVILPDSGLPVGTLERQFATRGWPQSFGERDVRRVHLVLPKLHVEQTIDLDSLLKKLGGGIAQDCRRADFSNMAMLRAGDGNRLCIGKALQKVYLDVDEEGTEAAAVTGLVLAVPTSAPPPPIEFVVDRPFLFVLRDEVTGADLFVGSIRRP